MLSAAARDRLVVVLVGARNPQNIGAAARAMQDFGFSHLRVVNDFAPPFEAARLEASAAVAADQIMRDARLLTSLPEAIEDCGYVVGTTAIGGRSLERPILTLQGAAPLLLAQLGAVAHDASTLAEGEPGEDRPKVALLFGSEKTGLTKEQLSFCTTLLTIPLYAPQGRHLSMNLGQAVAVTLYELTRSGFAGSRAIPDAGQKQPTVAVRERLLSMAQATMEATGYARRFPANARPEVLRQLALHLGESQDEVETWLGFFRQVMRTTDRSGAEE